MSDAARQEVLAELRRRRVAQIEAGIVAGETTRPRRLSWAQERLWFLSQLEERGEYNLIFAVRICGDFDRHAWDRAITAVVARHAILRTHFMSIDGRPYQVASAGSFSAEFVDLGELDRPDDALDDALRAESTRRFDLSTGPLLHGRVLRKSASEHVLIINVHHIVADGWSIGVFAREATDQYGRECGAQMPAPQPLAIQYADYAEWQRDQDGSAFESRALDHWREVLKGAPPVCNLPTDRPRRASRGERGGVHPFEIAPSLYERVQATAREHATAPFSVLLAAFFALLHRFSHDRDLCVGTPVANRGASAVEPLIGFFVNMVTMRCRLTPEMTFAALLDHVARLSTQALEYQAVPFAKVVQALNPERSLSHAPLFQIVFSLQNTPHGVLDFPRATVEPVPVATMAGAKYDLLFGLVEQSGRLHGAIEYDTGLFDSRSIDQMARAYITLLDDALAHPRACVGELRVLSVDPSSLALRVTDSVVEQAPFEGAMAMFERVVASVPDRIAVCAGSQTLSYAQLWRRVVRLARHLSDLGVGQEQLVGVCLDRGVDLVVALLAVMRAGGAYVPLDPAYPAERTRFILEDTRVGVVIASADLRAGLPDVEAQTICLGDAYWACDEEAASFCPDELAREAARMPGGPHPEGAAYVIYTSGSTGRPKGVAIRHRSLDVFLKWAHRRYGREAFSFALASTSICFDLSVFEIFAPLTGGGTVLVAQDALDLVNVPQRNRLTMMTVVPSALAALARDDVLPASLLVVNVAGEVLTRAVVDEAHGRVPRARLFNLYGPSEDTTFSTEFEVGQGASGEPSIGRPLPGTVAHVLDERLEPVSKGVVGELYLGGRGVARGYLGKAGLTAERFVPDPFEAGQRLYRTGDLVRSRWDGQLEYIGRADRQIKLRGHRIELGEIEGVLAAHPELQAAAVVLASGSGGAQGLVACCAPRTAVEPEALRVRLQRHLAERLPGYMVPARYLMLERLPLNANGKVDRGRLQDLGGQAWNAGGEDRRPLRGRHQHAVAQIWSEVLGRAEIGATDDFFELGGHSLLATQVLARLRERLGVEMALKTLFEHPRLDALAECVAGAAGRADAPALRRRGGGPLGGVVGSAAVVVPGPAGAGQRVLQHQRDGAPAWRNGQRVAAGRVAAAAGPARDPADRADRRRAG
ncbi:amino acid adenylation domain-containing protein [Burkholderia sp. FERM BP-3421]|uniref:amino acid adenylation domain-containing protein n=1 Tax=Burkholderia sp. FERM BP-3421 TaxID=1494466 RepID=UPI00235F8298|nr:amino acid adenylation domain-containing protein [Burkholderia sp. FERM BP-3421]WDD92430.1 amino acid adenylation domain-containing protein [Burkholderia sp. FERM BP-3421]